MINWIRRVWGERSASGKLAVYVLAATLILQFASVLIPAAREAMLGVMYFALHDILPGHVFVFFISMLNYWPLIVIIGVPHKDEDSKKWRAWVAWLFIAAANPVALAILAIYQRGKLNEISFLAATPVLSPFVAALGAAMGQFLFWIYCWAKGTQHNHSSDSVSNLRMRE